MTDVFLSYSSADRAAANAVQTALSARGHDVFWDQEVPAGQDWDDWIRTKLSHAPVCIVLWSKTSIASPNVRHEAMIARDAKKLVPAMIEALAPADFPMGLYLVQSVQLGDWRNARGPGMTRLVAEVEARLGRKGAAADTVAGRPALRPWTKIVIGLAGAALVATLAIGGWATISTDAKRAAEQAATSSPAPEPETFSAYLVGRWLWTDSVACTDGTLVTREGNTLVFTTPDSRFVHDIVSDDEDGTRTIVTAPESARGEKYLFVRAESGALADELSIQNITTQKTDTWTRCTPDEIGPADAAAAKRAEWLGVPEFEGTWVRGERGTTSCDGFPWRFEPAGPAMRWLTADAPMTVLVQKTDPPTLNLNGETLVYEADGQIHYYAPSGALYCTARRA